MSVGDSGARPKDSKFEPHMDVGAALYELEKQEKTFEKELKKFTPKKGLDDIGLLKAERDELKRQVMRNPKQDENKYWFCSNYQRGSCNRKSPHTAVIGYERKMVRHMCATCYLTY